MSTLLQDDVVRHAQARPDHPAIVAEGEAIGYGQLDAWSSKIAQLLRATGCRRGDRVGLLMPKRPLTIAAMIAVLKADAIYVPLDPASPAARTARIVRAADPAILVASPSTSALLDELADLGALQGRTVGTLEPDLPAERSGPPAFRRSDWEAQEPLSPPARNGPADPAHLLFTSGSTGTPKGVVITHANARHFIEWGRRHFDLAPEDRISGHPPLHFDLSTFDIYGTFAAGATLYPVPPRANLLPNAMAAFIRESGLTQWFSVPSVLTYMANHGAVRHGDFPTLRRLLWCGEAMPVPTLIHLMDRLPHVRFTNLYGPTEATIASSHYTVPQRPREPDEEVPIGTACDGEELLLLDERLRPVPDGGIGEIYIAGPGLSPGYWRDPQTTAAAFLPYPGTEDPARRIYRTGDLGRRDEHGRLHCLGRVDSQIKSRGYRIELGEIETALHALGLLRESAVVGVPSTGFEGTAIACAYAADGTLDPATIRRRLADLLPGYMLPSRWLALDRLPKNANGKTDRRELRRRFQEITDDQSI